MISVLSLVVAILAVFFGPLVAWTVARQQIAVASRETWLREFREQVALFLATLTSMMVFRPGDISRERRAVHSEALFSICHTIQLLIAEKELEYPEFLQHLDIALAALTKDDREIREALAGVAVTAEKILQRERAAITADPGVWRALQNSLRINAVQWRPWLQLKAWACGRPRFPN